jgi:hypothetical protein
LNGFIAQLPEIGRNPVELRASFVTNLSLSSDEAASATPGEHWPIPMRILPGSNLRIVRASANIIVLVY